MQKINAVYHSVEFFAKLDHQTALKLEMNLEQPAKVKEDPNI